MVGKVHSIFKKKWKATKIIPPFTKTNGVYKNRI